MENSTPDLTSLYEYSMVLARCDPRSLSLLRSMSFDPVLGPIKLIQALVTRVTPVVGQRGYYTSSNNSYSQNYIDTLGRSFGLIIDQ